MSAPDGTIAAGAFPWAEHPLRRQLAGEVHARPFELLRPPVRASHLAVTGQGLSHGEEWAHLNALCARFNIAPPPADAIYFAATFGAFRLRWERHAEFSTYTFFRFDAFDDPFAQTAVALAPRDWLADIPGKVMVANHLALDDRRRSASEMATIFAGHGIIGCAVVGGSSEVFTDFHIHDDGFGRFLVYDLGLTHGQAGRLTQRLFEIETYRTMALLSLPSARQLGPDLTAMNDELAQITANLASEGGPAGDRDLLARLTSIAAKAEHLSSAHSYRFSASKAYYVLVQKRVEELREQRIPGMQTIAEFMERRLGPAMSTCEATTLRHASLSQRIARTSDLLRTRVDIGLEEQNRDLLKSMNRRAELQLRLQETVEGLSVVAISYYTLSLIGHVTAGLHSLGLPVDPEKAELISFPVVVGMVALGIRRLRKAVTSKTSH